MTAVPRDLPSGTVTFLFTDVEGSTKLLHALGPDVYAEALAEHRRILRHAFGAHGGVEVDTQGDAFFVAFPTASGALRVAAEVLEGLASGPIRVRMGIHTGTPHLGEEGYIGTDVHRAARIAAAGHGGQVLVSAATAALVAADGLRDLGEHRLKDLSAPERIYQLGDADFPALKSLHQTNLPIPATPFLGRGQEVAEVTALLNRDAVRLLTLTGPGGTGKTRLALQSAAASTETFVGGVWWVPLAPLRDPALVVEAAARAIGATGDIAEYIGDSRLLLLFDNFEQVVEAATDVAALLLRCPQLSLLVTSREALRLEGEWEYAVDPLRETEAVELFHTRARAARRDFEVNGEVREICARLDNLPLAIELAAARVKVLSPRALLERLEQRLPMLQGGTRDAPERQRTLRATIQWSHELLTAEEQRLFARLGVFRGGCTLEAAEAIADANLDSLQSLVDKSLVRQRDDRFRMLETIREYAVDRLDASGEADGLRGRHAEHFLALAEEAFPNLRGSPKIWLERLEREHDNLRAALERFEAAGDTQRALRLTGALWKFWNLRGHTAEGGRRLENALAADSRPTAARARALNGATAMAMNEDPALSRRRGEEALELNRRLDDPAGIANSVFMLAADANEQEDFARAVPLLDESLRLFSELGDDHYVLLSMFHLGWALEELGEVERARGLNKDMLRRARAAGNERMVAAALDSRAYDAVEEDRLDEALEALTEAVRIYRDVGETVKIPDSLARFARVHAAGGAARTAAQLLSKSLAMYEELGASVPPYVSNRNELTRAAIHAHLDEAAFAEASEEGRRMTVDEAVALAVDS